ncbi:MAG: nitrilase [Gammaproteobacteria bacterium]|nr:nitrilase [Gammaproteobacteria bacterium]MDE0367451.1 nitrilase [Gammaproteobacteria bacterium]
MAQDSDQHPTLVSSYAALALQFTVHAINRCPDVASSRKHIDAALERVAAQVAASRQFIGEQLKLVVLPEYFLTSYPLGESIAAWRQRACIDPGGREYERLGRIARDSGVYLSGNLYETDPNFPELYFQTSFIIDDAGDAILRYRRLISMYGPTPHDVLDRYLDVYGADSLFPVAATPLGRLAAVASEEILFPEVSRALVLNGAELICHSSSEIASPAVTPKHAAKLARAYENHVYIVSANTAGIAGIDLPNESVDRGSKVVDYAGRVLAEAASGESMAAYADIHIDALRDYRRRPGLFNVLARQRLDLFSRIYSDDAVYPANSLLDDDGKVIEPERAHFMDTQRRVIQALMERGVI